jgi:hypothetical protein
MKNHMIMRKLIIFLAVLAVACTEKIDILDDSKDPVLFPSDKLDQPVTEGTYTGYVYSYGFCNEPFFWHQFTDYQQRIDLFQIPDEAMHELTTEGLSQSCMYYPLRYDMWAFDRALVFIRYHIEVYNGLNELARRAYGPAALLKLYERMKLADPENDDEKEGLEYDKDINLPWCFQDRNYLEALLSSEFFTPNMTAKELKRLADAIKEKVDDIATRDLHSYQIGYAFPYSVLCRILLIRAEREMIELTENEKEQLTLYIETSGTPYFEAEKTYEIVKETLRMISRYFPEMYILPLDKIFVMQ